MHSIFPFAFIMPGLYVCFVFLGGVVFGFLVLCGKKKDAKDFQACVKSCANELNQSISFIHSFNNINKGHFLSIFFLCGQLC